MPTIEHTYRVMGQSAREKSVMSEVLATVYGMGRGARTDAGGNAGASVA